MEHVRSCQECARGEAESAHAATIAKAEHTFAAAGIFPYRPHITSDEDFEPSENARKDKTPDENFEETEDGHRGVDSPFRVYGPDLPTSASPRTPDNITAARNYCSHYHGSNIPTDKSFCGRQTTQEKISGFGNFAWNTFQNVY
jgi:hypothetical protein